MTTGGDGRAEVRAALGESQRLFASIGLFSIFVNLLMLTGPLFMLQIYDRVLTSHSEATLVAQLRQRLGQTREEIAGLKARAVALRDQRLLTVRELRAPRGRGSGADPRDAGGGPYPDRRPFTF